MGIKRRRCPSTRTWTLWYRRSDSDGAHRTFLVMMWPILVVLVMMVLLLLLL